MKNILITGLLSLTLFMGYGQDYYSIKDSIQSILDKKEIPGAFVTVVTKDSILFQEGFGFADIDKKESVTSEHLFRLGSVTKTFTAMTIMKLVRDRKLSLEDELKTVAPEIPFKNKWEETHPVRIKHLLSHRSGFDDFHISRLTNIMKKPKGTILFEEVLFYQNSFESNWKPGLVKSYSNPGYVILGYVIEKISGESYQSFIEEQVLIPLGMKNTSFISRSSNDENLLAKGYRNINDKIIQIPENQNMYGETGGGLMSNAVDMSKFLQFLLNEKLQDTSGVLNHSTILEMEQLQSQIEKDNKIKSGYSIGLHDRQFGNPKINFKGHSGAIDGFVSNFIYSRENDIGIAISSNLFGKGYRPVLDLLVNKFCKTKNSSGLYQINEFVSLDKFKSWEGEHRQLNEDNEIFHYVNFPIRTKKIEFEENKLLVSEFLGETEEFFHVSENAFKAKGELLPSLYLIDFEGEKSINYYGFTFIRTSSLAYFLIRLGLIVSLITGVILILITVVQLFFFKRIKKITLIRNSTLAFSHILIIGSSILFFMNYFLYDSIKNLGEFTSRSITLFIMTLLYPISCIVAFVILYKEWKNIKKTYGKIFYCISAFSCLFMTVYCISLDWFALKLWEY